MISLRHCISIFTLPIAFLLSALSFSGYALPETCIQDPQRSTECPRLIYKSASLPDPQTGRENRQLVCICLTDFEDLLTEENNDVSRKMKEMRINSWTAQLGISEEKLKELIKY